MGLFGFIGDVIKKKVSVPQFKDVVARDIESTAFKDYSAGLGDATRFTRDVNEENQGAIDRQFAAKIPGFSEVDSRVSRNLLSELSGEIPSDVSAQVMRRSQARALEGGYGGSQFGENLTARDLGLTSLAISQQGLSNAMNWISNVRQNRLAPSMSPSSLFITPEARLNLAVSERDKRLNRDYLASQLRAAQHWRTSMGNQMNSFDQMLTSVASSYGGGMVGGMGGTFGGGGGGSGGGAYNFSTGPAAQAGGWATM